MCEEATSAAKNLESWLSPSSPVMTPHSNEQREVTACG